MTVYTVANSKGGVGKTACAAELAWRLAKDGRRVLACDLDQQGQLGARLGIDVDVPLRGTLADVLRADATIAEAATVSPHNDYLPEDDPDAPRLHVLHGTSDLKDAEKDVADLVTALRDCLPAEADRFDDVVIDTPGDIGDLLLCGLAAADVLIVPVSLRPDTLDQLEGFQTEAIARVARRMNRGLRIHWVVPTMYDPKVAAQRESLEDLTSTYDDLVTEPIRMYAAVYSAFAYGAPASLWQPKSRAAAAYTTVLDTILGGPR